MSERPYVCPDCGRTYPRSERFCEDCAMPLVHVPGSEHAAGERRRRARKIKPQYTDGPLVRVARAANQPEAELISALLLEEGIPCLVRNSIGGYSAVIGEHDVLVPESGAEAACEMLAPAKRPGGAQA